MASHAWDVNWTKGTREQFLAIRAEIIEGGIPEENANGIALYVLEGNRQKGERYPSHSHTVMRTAQSARPETIEKYSQLFEDMVSSGKNFDSFDEIN